MKLPIVITDEALTCGRGKFANALSENGLFVPTDDACPLKTKIPLKFKVGGKILSADAVVIYTYKPGNQAKCEPGMGLDFVQISDQDQGHIRSFIRSQVETGPKIAGRNITMTLAPLPANRGKRKFTAPNTDEESEEDQLP